MANAKDEGCKEDLDQLQEWFPQEPCTKYSLAWDGRTENECTKLLDSHREVIDKLSTAGAQDLKEKGVFFTGPVVRPAVPGSLPITQKYLLRCPARARG